MFSPRLGPPAPGPFPALVPEPDMHLPGMHRALLHLLSVLAHLSPRTPRPNLTTPAVLIFPLDFSSIIIAFKQILFFFFFGVVVVVVVSSDSTLEISANTIF